MKYALVTGGSRGIGRAVCVRLAALGYHVIINYVADRHAAEETLALARQAGGDGELLQFDVADRIRTRSALHEWELRHQGAYIEVLVNNAGIRHDSTLMLMQDHSWDRVLAVTLDGFYNVTQPLLLPMQAHRHGRIVNMASVSGLKGLPGQTNYSAAKGGLIAATKALALEVARSGVTVNAIAPGFIATDMVSDLDVAALRQLIPARRLGRAEEVAALVAFVVSDEAGYITGNVISINGGLYT